MKTTIAAACLVVLALPAAAQPAADANTVLRGITNVRVITILSGDAAERSNCLDDAHLPAIHDAVVGRLAAAGIGVPRQRALQRLNAAATSLMPQPNDTAVPLLTVTVEQAGAMFGAEVGCSYTVVATLGTLVRGGRVASSGTALPETRNSYIWLTSGGNIGNPAEVRERVVTTAAEIADYLLAGLRAAGFEAPRRDAPVAAGVPSRFAVPPSAPVTPAPLMPGGDAEAKPTAAPAATPPSAAAAAAPVHDCDRLAQPEREEMGAVPALVPGVSYFAIDRSAASAACAAAMRQYPNEPRFPAYAARILSGANNATNNPEIVRLYRIAAERGNPVGQQGLGAFYRAGWTPVARNETEAARLRQLAADQGYNRALEEQAEIAEYGSQGGYARNSPEALRLYRIAAANGSSRARRIAESMERDGVGR